MKRWKSYIAYAMAGFMMVGSMPLQAFAEESTEITQESEEELTTEVSEEEETTAVTFDEVSEEQEETTVVTYDTVSEVEEAGAATASDFEDIENHIFINGSCGDSAAYDYEIGTDTLYITGQGEINDYTEDNPAPWHEYKEDIKNVVIGSGITGIGQYNFYDMTQVISFELPNTLTKIGEAAFLQCKALTSIQIPDSVTKIDAAAFAGCDLLEALVIPDSVTELGSTIAVNCPNLKSATLPKNLTVLPWGLFSSDSSLTSVEIPENVTEIQSYCFAGCSSLSNINIPEGVVTIDKQAFSDTALTSVTLPKNITYIETEAFLDCFVLEEVTILSEKYAIADYAFGYTKSTGGNYEKVDSLTIKAYRGTAGETYATENGFTFVALDEAETSGQCGENAYWEYDETTKTLSITGSGRMYDYRPSGQSGYEDVFYMTSSTTAPWNGLGYEKVSISGIDNIGAYAFAGFESSLKEVVINANITEIGKAAFNSCEQLLHINIPETVTSIGEEAFNACHLLTDVTLPASVTEIKRYTFYRCFALNSINLEYVTTIGERAFASSHLEEIKLSPELQSIGRYGLANCDFTEILIPDSVSYIEEGAFYSSDSLKEITLPETISYVGNEAFNFCDELNKITILNSRMRIGENAFGYLGTLLVDGQERPNYNSSLVIWGYAGSTAETYANEKEIKFQDLENIVTEGKCGDDITWKYDKDTKALTLTGTGAMYDYTDEEDDNAGRTLPPWSLYAEEIKTVTISEGITTIGDTSFDKTESLTDVSLPTTLKTIGTWGFASSGIREITLPEGFEELGYQTFGWCENLTSITFPASLTNLGFETFVKCTALKKITFKGGISYIRDSIFPYCTSVEEINLAEGTKTLAGYAFYNMSVKKITVPKSVTSIEEKALGYHYDENPGEAEKIEGFTIQGYSKTAAETYAKENGFTFYALDKAENIKKETISLISAAPRKQGMALAWKPSKNAETYKVYRKTGSGKYAEIKTSITEEKDIVGCIDTTVKSGTSYTYKVIASYQGIESKTKEKTAYYLSEPAVTLKSGSSGITVSWKKVTGASGYYIYRKVGSGSYTKVATAKSTATSYLDKKASAGKTNTYKVYAYKSSPKTNSSYTAKSLLYLKPTKLTLSRKNKNSTTIGLKWTKVSGAKGYYIYRKAKGGKYAKIATIKSASTLKYTDKKAKKGVSYTYYVVAYNGSTIAPYTAKTK